MTKPAKVCAQVMAGDRIQVVGALLRALFAVVPLRRACAKPEALGILSHWDVGRETLYGTCTIEVVIQRLATDLAIVSVPELPDLRLVDVACLLAEALLISGRRDEGLAFLDTAASLAGAARLSTRVRVQALEATATNGAPKLIRQGADEDILRALPADKYSDIEERSGRNLDVVKKRMPVLRRTGLVEGDRYSGYRRTDRGNARLQELSDSGEAI